MTTDPTSRARRPGVTLTSAQADRAAGVLLATACGDALGAGYEFGPPLPRRHDRRDDRRRLVRLGAGGVDRRHLDGDPDRAGRGDRRRPA